jgi:hypothetical protein
MNITIGAIVLLGLAIIAGLWAFGRRERKAGQDQIKVQAQKEVIDEQQKVQAARVATADPGTGRADRLRDRFTRRD